MDSIQRGVLYAAASRVALESAAISNMGVGYAALRNSAGETVGAVMVFEGDRAVEVATAFRESLVECGCTVESAGERKVDVSRVGGES
jgi:hypothetical protein